MIKNSERKGEIISFIEITIWALFPVLAVLSFSTLPSLISLAWSGVFSALFFVCAVLIRRKWKDFTKPILWKAALIGAVSINICFYSLYYIGLTMTSPGNGSIIALFEIFTAFLFFNVLMKEKISGNRILGALLMVAGAIIVVFPDTGNINLGDVLILIATFFCPVGNYYAQKAREVVSSESIMLLRTLIATPVLFLLAYIFGMHASFEDVRGSLMFLFISGFVLFGFTKILWVEQIRFISVTKALALSSVGPLFTILFAWALIGTYPTLWQLLSLIPFALGVLLLTDYIKVWRSPDVIS
ncbi:MAG TPA: DMT family transporter [Candidatus Paceibacterota bacterium]|nr:DMT family transporter [Candidatus Paceibacterota bacterium]